MVWARIQTQDAEGAGAGRRTEPDSAHEADARSPSVRVPGALPGETVPFRTVHRGARKEVGRLATGFPILNPSAERVEPACPHFLACGGCQLLHQDLKGQHRFKRARVAEALGLAVDAVDPVVASPESFGYRHWAKLVVDPAGVLGSYRPRSHDVTSMQGCRVHAPAIEALAQALRVSWAGAGRAPAGLRYVLVRASRHAGRVVATFVARSPAAAEDLDPEGWDRLRGLLAGRPEVAGARLQRRDADDDVVFGQGPVEEMVEPFPLEERFGPLAIDLARGGFNQVNPGAAERLYRHAVRALQVDGRTVADLYAGSGGLTAHVLQAGATSVTAVESAAEGVAAIRASLDAAIAQGRLQVHAEPVETSAPRWRHAERAILNPPRKGLHPQVGPALRRSAAERAVYVSCDPKTLARDLKDLEPDFRIDQVTPFDLFPHTRHVETAVLLTRR